MIMDEQTLVLDPEIIPEYGSMAITGGQIRAARSLLRWSVTQLAEKSGVSYHTILRAESVDDEFPPLRVSTLQALETALQQGGVVFLARGENRYGGNGVRLRIVLRRPST
jgi:transcriptional regulator with XRE-family HTH domain